MNSAVKVSIIIPVYNGQKYVQRCLDSICHLDNTDWECILIDDGSIDDSAKLLSKYVEIDPRFSLISTSNGGVSRARNLGIQKVKGQWISFVDIDDWVSPDYFYSLELDIADRYDIIIFNNCRNYEDRIVSFSQSVICDSTSKRNLLSDKMSELLFLAPWGKAFRTDLIKNHHLQFNEQLRYGEDAIFNLDAFAVCNNLYCYAKGIYHYYVPNKYVSALEKYGLSADHIISFLNNFGQRYFQMGIECVKYERLVLWQFTMLEKWCSSHKWKGRMSYYHNEYQKRLEERVLHTFGFYQRFCYRFCSMTPDFMQWARKILVSRY